jgi:hypothetical protein
MARQKVAHRSCRRPHPAAQFLGLFRMQLDNPSSRRSAKRPTQRLTESRDIPIGSEMRCWQDDLSPLTADIATRRRCARSTRFRRRGDAMPWRGREEPLWVANCYPNGDQALDLSL